MTAARLALVLAVTGCQPSSPPPALASTAVVVGPCALDWPAPPRVESAREGRHARGTVAWTEEGGARHEVAVFVRDEPLAPALRERLLAAVVRGLAARPDVRDHHVERRDDGSVEVSLELHARQRARYRIFVTDARTLVEVSVRGASPGVDALATRFFASATCAPLSAARRGRDPS